MFNLNRLNRLNVQIRNLFADILPPLFYIVKKYL